MRLLTKFTAGVGSLLFPLLAFASDLDNFTVFENANPDLTFTVISNKIGDIANSIIPFLIGLTVALIVWGIFKYVMAAGDTEKVAEGRKVVIYGIVALFMMLSFWGLVLIIQKSIFG